VTEIGSVCNLTFQMYSSTSYTTLKNDKQEVGIFHDFPGPRQDSRTFQALENVLIKFHDFPGPVATLQAYCLNN